MIPIALFGIAMTIFGASLVWTWWVDGGRMPVALLTLLLFAGPGSCIFAAKIYRDPTI